MWCVFECSLENSYNFSVCLKMALTKCWGNGDVKLCALTWKGVHEIEEKFQNCRQHSFCLETQEKKTGKI